MKRTAILLPLCALLSCREVTPCDGIAGTCLTLRVASSSGLGERVDEVRFAIEGDGAFRHEAGWGSDAGGQILPVTLALALPDEAQRTIKINAEGAWNGRTILYGSRVVSSLVPGARRSVELVLSPPGGPGGANCTDGAQNGTETGVDCGGACEPCAPTCTDLLKNGDESDVDCGGSCNGCAGGQACGGPGDCLSGRCDAKACFLALGIQSLSPDSGPTTGGIEITLRGDLLTTDMQVRFGPVQAAVLRAAPDGRSAVVSLPQAAAGPSDVTVVRGATTAERKGGFAYYFGSLRFGTMPMTSYFPGDKPYFVVSGHYNGRVDRFLDIAVVNEIDSTVALWLGKGDGTFTRGNLYPVGRMPGTYPLTAQNGDFNGDGQTDLVLADNRQPTISVLVGNGDGTFRASAEYDLPPGAERAWPPSVGVADFNADGLDDVAATDSMNGGKSYVFLANPDRSGALLAALFVAGSDILRRDVDSTLVAGRLDGDTFGDLVVATSAQRIARVFLGRGDGTFRAAAEIAMDGVGTFSLRLADVNGDGKADLLSANRGSDNVSVFLGKGDGAFGPPKTVKTAAGPFSLTMGDLDGDGRVDLAAPCFSEMRMGQNVARLMLGDGAGAFPRSGDVLVPTSAFGITSGDYNGDGRLDLAVSSVFPANQLTILVNLSQ